MLTPNETIIEIRFEGNLRKQSPMRHQKRTMFGTPKKSSHAAGPSGNEYYEQAVNIPCFFRGKTTYAMDGSVRKDGTLEYEPEHGEPEINVGAIVRLEFARHKSYRVTEVEDDTGVLGGTRVVRLTLKRTAELHSTT